MERNVRDTLRQAARRELGFFLIEVGVTLIIITTLLFAYMSAISRSLYALKRSRQLSSGASLAGKTMFSVVADFRKTKDPSPRSGTAEIGGYSCQWDAMFEPVEDTENAVYIMKLRILQGDYVISEIETAVMAPE
jgi:hypothetical protein